MKLQQTIKDSAQYSQRSQASLQNYNQIWKKTQNPAEVSHKCSEFWTHPILSASDSWNHCEYNLIHTVIHFHCNKYIHKKPKSSSISRNTRMKTAIGWSPNKIAMQKDPGLPSCPWSCKQKASMSLLMCTTVTKTFTPKLVCKLTTEHDANCIYQLWGLKLLPLMADHVIGIS